jgi:LPXTG-site transpeptidase (sortase) family protein
MVMACLVFLVGLLVSAQTLWTNHRASIQVAALAKQASKQVSGSQSVGLPSTVRPTNQAINQYAVSPDLARYLKIPKLNVYARVLQVGITASGAVGTPNNVFDTAWYTGSAKPGQSGATLIDGHISSWTTHGVFYNLKQLAAGDTMQIVRGDGSLINYQVVRTQTYNINNVDMKAALSPVTPGKSGLNLISCTGQVEKGTNQFNERVIVFAQQI